MAVFQATKPSAGLLLFAGAWLFLFSFPCPGQDSILSQKIEALAKKHEGKVSICVKHLETGEITAINADTPMPTASLIKLAIMVCAYNLSDEGKANLASMVTLKEEDKVPGSGILTKNFSAGATFSLKDAIRLMIAYSDNSATNLVLDQIGIRTVNTSMEAMGFANTKVNAKVFKGSTTSVAPERTKQFGLGSTTARETVNLLERIHQGKAAKEPSCKAIIEHLKQCEDKDMLPRHLPAGVIVAHKTGSVSDARTAAGILYFKGGPVAICILTTENKDKTWTRENAASALVAAISKQVFDHYNIKK